MEQKNSIFNLYKTKPIITILTLVFLFSFTVRAQDRNMGFMFSENLRGGTALFGNTLMNAVNPDLTPNLTAMNGSSVNGNSIYDNGGTTNMQYVDIDGNTGDGTGTRNSSSADLVLPAGTNTVRVARLYWGGRAVTSDFDMTQPSNQTIKIRKGTSGAYQEYSAMQLNKKVVNPGLPNEYCFYQAYIDITDLVKQQGAGTYTVGNGAFSTGVIDDYGYYGAWSILVVYENPALNFNSVRVYDGLKETYNGGGKIASNITLTGLNVPATGLTAAEAQIGIMGWEGDARYIGDSLKINNVIFNNAFNQPNNFWNGSITTNGSQVTTKYPNYTDQMSVDIDQFEVGVGYGILPNATDLTIEFLTADDQFFLGIVTLVIKMKDPPVIKLTKAVTDANNNNLAEVGEVITYKLKGKNISLSNVNFVELKDSLQTTMTYVQNSLKVNYCPGITTGIKTDVAGDDIAEFTNNTVIFKLGTGANATTGGILAAADSFEVEFNVTVNTPVSGNVPPIVNVARLNAKTDALVDYVDDATAVIFGISAAPLPVKLTSFTANLIQDNLVKVTWSTSMENNSLRFDIERSTDGVIFKTIASKAARGNSSTPISYFINDDITTVTTPFVYYRLRQLDIDGKNSISKVVSVKIKKTAGEFTVSPNPFRNNLNINIEWDKNETTVVKVFSAAGSEVITKNVKMIKGQNYIAMDELSKLQPGNYIIQFVNSNQKMIKQVVKQ